MGHVTVHVLIVGLRVDIEKKENEEIFVMVTRCECNAE